MAVPKVNYDDPNSYKACRKKQYEIWMCKPPVGTIVINKMEQADIVRKLNGKTFFTVADIAVMQQKGNPLYQQLSQLAQQGLIYMVKDQDVVLSGTRGELWVTSIAKVQKTYLVSVNGQWGNNWARATQERGATVNGQFVLPWMKIRAIGEAASGTFACFVPLAQKGQIKTSWAILNFNAAGVDHGLGDFILCAKGADGKPNMGDRWVVNGAVFADTYNNQGWQGCLKTTGVDVNTPEPAPLFEKPADTMARFSELVKAFHEEFRGLGNSYKLESKRGQSNEGVDITYRVRANDDAPITFTVLLKPKDSACKVVNMAFSSERWNVAFDFEMKGKRPMLPMAKHVWGILHEDAGLSHAVEWKLSSIAKAFDEAISHNLVARGFSIHQHGTGRSGEYATMGYAISGHGQSGIELRVRVGLAETNRVKTSYKCKFKDAYNDSTSFHMKDIQSEAEELVTESLIGAGFPFDM